jgi:DNA processing protein
MHPDEQREFWSCLALRWCQGLGASTWKRLLEHYGSARAAVADVDGWVGRGLASRRQQTAFRSEAWREAAREEWDHARRRGYAVVLWSDPGYPALLRQIPSPPLFLYCQGDLSLLANPCVAMVGTRNCTAYGRETAGRIARDLARAGVTVVSGLAHGIDSQAHVAALNEPGSTIAVLGTGLDNHYPPENADLRRRITRGGLVVSEFAPATKVERGNFPMRNRVVSGLSLGVIVVETRKRGGGLITASQALEQNREVFAVPGPAHAPTSAGCHALINDGARLATTAEQVLQALVGQLGRTVPAPQAGAEGPRTANPRPAARAGQLPLDVPQSAPQAQPEPVPAPDYRPPGPEAAGASEEERALLSVLKVTEQVHIDTLGATLQWDPGRVGRVLIGLEMRGLVKQWPGMNYTLAQ